MTATVIDAGDGLPKEARNVVHGRVGQAVAMMHFGPADSRDCFEPGWVNDTLASLGQAGQTQTGF